ncbi:MAG: hypothetical protein ACYC1U_09685 [Candidatus Aquicultorales bacterium]
MKSVRKGAAIIGAAVIVSLLLTAIVEFAYAKKYDVQVNVEKGQGSFGVNPMTDRLDFGDMPLGSRSNRFVDLENSGGRKVYVIVFITGEVSNFIVVKPNYFTLDAAGKKKLTFELNIPRNAQTTKYRGRAYMIMLPRLL